MSEPILVLSSQIKGILEIRRITIEELANKSQVPIVYISDWIIGAIPHNLLLVKKLALYLEISMDQLCFGRETYHSTFKSQIDTIPQHFSKS